MGGCRVTGRTVRRLVARTMAAARLARTSAQLAEVEQVLEAAVRSFAL